MKTTRGLVFLLFCTHLRAFADTPINAWTNPASGNWQDQRWSLGILPAAGQTIMLTNQGWKAIAIGPSTVQDFSGSLDVSSVTLGGYTDSFNLLLLNYAGFEVPLTAGNLQVGTNSGVTALASVLNVSTNSGTGDLAIESSFNQGESAIVSANTIHVGTSNAPGVYNLTNGTLSAGTAVLGMLDFSVQPTNHNIAFNQLGGSATIDSLQVDAGEYNASGGSLAAGLVKLRHGNFNQTGGSVTGALQIAVGTYAFSGGILHLPNLSLPNNLGFSIIEMNATVQQTGGTNFCDSITLFYSYGATGIPVTGPGRYVLSNGVLNVSGQTFCDGGGSFRQWGGVHTNAGTELKGYDDGRRGPRYGGLALGAGLFLTPYIGIDFGSFLQSGGTNRVSGAVVLGTAGHDSTFTLSGGELADQSTAVLIGGSPFYTPYAYAAFTQTGGSHVITNDLYVNGANNYSWTTNGYILSGGQLTVPDIELVNGASFYHLGGTLRHSGLLTLAGGTWQEQSSGQQFGQLLLGGSSSSNRTLSLPGGASQLRFAASASIPWSNQVVLVIDHWSGSPAGGGQHQIVFGSNASSLTPRQLSQIEFRNPAGVNGLFPARILPSGEIVPDRFLSARTAAHNLTIEWSSGTLQSSTNVTGPYQNVSGATSPYTAPFTEPQRFFRIRN
jgi:hypothetical protein